MNKTTKPLRDVNQYAHWTAGDVIWATANRFAHAFQDDAFDQPNVEALGAIVAALYTSKHSPIHYARMRVQEMRDDLCTACDDCPIMEKQYAWFMEASDALVKRDAHA